MRQDNLSLPPGPLFLNPKSLLQAGDLLINNSYHHTLSPSWFSSSLNPTLQAGKLEVIEKRPELFKIECLTKLRELFLCPTPFFAGYGNRQNDLVAYQAVGIPRCRVFLINKLGILSGQVSCLNLNLFYKILQVALNQQSSYCGHCDLVSLLFPALSTSTIINLATKVREVSFTTWSPL